MAVKTCRNGQNMKNELYSNDIIFAVSDIDECTDGTHDCDVNAECNNTQGSHNCTCKDGFHGNGTNCAGNFLLIFFELLLCDYYIYLRCLHPKANDYKLNTCNELFTTVLHCKLSHLLINFNSFCCHRYRRVC